MAADRGGGIAIGNVPAGSDKQRSAMANDQGEEITMATDQDRGLLDLSVELSTRDVMAGHEFALFVLVKNPFAKPIWIRKVHVSLPSELAHSSAKKAEAKAKTEAHAGKPSKLPERTNGESARQIGHKLDALTQQVAQLGEKLHAEGIADEDVKELLQRLESRLSLLWNRQRSLDEEETKVYVEQGARIKSLQVHSDRPNVYLERSSDVDYIEVAEPWLVLERHARAGTVELESSLPDNTALQPGNTVVYTVVLKVKGALLFRPSRYRLQFNVNYSFSPKPPIEPAVSSMGEEGLFANTVASELSIRASIYSIITGSAIGGLMGGIARVLQITDPAMLTPANLFTLAVAIILSIMAIIFMARKSEAQSFLSVEDFWGGLLVGFLVGYSGTSFFEGLTGVSGTAAPAS